MVQFTAFLPSPYYFPVKRKNYIGNYHFYRKGAYD